MEIWSQEIIDGNLKPFKTLVDLLGLKYKEKDVLDFISPEFWHRSSKHNKDSISQ